MKNKKNILTFVVAMVLVAALSVGGTLAFLTATDKEVKNTFTFAENMTVTVTEPKPEPVEDEEISGDPEEGWSYTNVVPNQLLNKAPQFTTKTAVPAYVFVRISGASDNVQPAAASETDPVITNGWLPLNGTGYKDENYNGVYYKKVPGSPDEQDLLAIFTKVKVDNPDLNNAIKDEEGNVKRVKLDPITIEVYEIQEGTFANVQEAYKATPWGASATPETPETPETGA